MSVDPVSVTFPALREQSRQSNLEARVAALERQRVHQQQSVRVVGTHTQASPAVCTTGDPNETLVSVEVLLPDERNLLLVYMEADVRRDGGNGCLKIDLSATDTILLNLGTNNIANATWANNLCSRPYNDVESASTANAAAYAAHSNGGMTAIEAAAPDDNLQTLTLIASAVGGFNTGTWSVADVRFWALVL